MLQFIDYTEGLVPEFPWGADGAFVALGSDTLVPKNCLLIGPKRKAIVSNLRFNPNQATSCSAITLEAW